MARSYLVGLRVVMAGSLVQAAAACDGCAKGSSSASPDAAPPPIEAGGPVNATPVPTASVAQMVNPDNLPPYSGPTGSIEGTVYVVGDPPEETPADFSKCPSAAAIWGKSFRERSPSAGRDAGAGARSLADAIVAVTGYTGFYLPETREASSLSIEGCGFSARTVTMTYGQRLEVKNLTNEFWTPLLEPGANLVMMMAAPKGDPVKIYPKKPGHYLLVDRDRKYAISDVYAFLHPLHAATDGAGHYRIDGVPIGKVKINARHPRFDDEKTLEVEIAASVVSDVDLVLRHTTPPDAGPADAAPARPRLR